MLWRPTLVLLLVIVLTVSTARAQSTASDAADIQGIIKNQIEAFRQGDGITAFGLASATIQQTFKSPEGFMAMVKQSYGALINPRRLAFFDLIEQRGVAIQRVLVEKAEGGLVIAIYPMARQPDGTWRIDGCALQEVPASET